MMSAKAKHGVLLVNLGSPETCTVPAIRKFLGEFLTDPDVITLKSPFRQILFKGIVAPIRSRKILEKYASIWHKESGLSPLHYITNKIEKDLQQCLGDHFVVANAMRYQKPSLKSVCNKLDEIDLKSLTVIPLFPQEAKETTGSIYNALKKLESNFSVLSDIGFINNYFEDNFFINALCESYQPALTNFKPDVVLWSYHGLPNQSVKPFCTQACVKGGFQKPCDATGKQLYGNQSCYRAQCYATSRMLEKKLSVVDCSYQTVFQSRFGPLKWIGPGLLTAMEEQAKQGKKRIAIACPSFITDCLETLEEVNIAAREYWQELGGEDFLFLPCVNNQSVFIRGLSEKVKHKIKE
jgi:ferrochelatase